MEALELVLYTTWTCHVEHQVANDQAKVELWNLTQHTPNIFGLQQHHNFNALGCLTKSSSKLGYSQYCGYLMLMASTKAH